MNSHFDTERLHTLASRLCDGEISTQEIDELSSLIDGNEAAASEYMAYTSLHLNLGQRLRESHPGFQNATDAQRSTGDDVIPALATVTDRRKRFAQKRWFSLLVLAASLLVAVTIWIKSSNSAPPYAARIDEIVDCDWSEAHRGAPQSQTLDAGREIKFNHGLMILEFGNGAEVTLEGPVRFTISASDRGQLSFGKLSAAVPERGHGFAIQLPAAEVVDLGTRFGALVAEDGSCEAHVFEGNVLVHTDSDKRPPQEWKLSAGSALRFVAVSNEVKQLTAKPAAFVQAAGFTDPVGPKETTSVKPPSGGGLALWLDAARQIQLDDAGKVIGWGNLGSVEQEGNENDAWQVNAKQRPTWVPHALGSRPAIRFDGSSHLVTTPISSGSDVSIFCVFQIQPPSPSRHSRQILNLNGPPNLVLGITSENDVVAGLESTLESQDPIETGRLESLLPAGEAPVVVAYVYGHSLNKCWLYVNQKLVGEAQASLAAAVRSPKFIGASNSIGDHFVGDLGELLLFDSMLTSDQCVQISADLMQKYGVLKAEREPRVLSHLIPDQE